jgi:hypothetical protein
MRLERTMMVAMAAAVIALRAAAAEDRPAAAASGEGAPAASKGEAGAAKRPADKPQRAGAAPAAAHDLARVLVSNEDWNHALDQYSAGLSQQITQSLSQRGEKAPEGLQASIRKELGQELPYQQVVEREAAALAKHFTPDELKRAIAFYTSPLGKKAIQAIPQSQAELGRDLQERLSSAVPQIVQRLAPKAMERPEAGAAAGSSPRAGSSGDASRSSAGPPPSGSGSSSAAAGDGASAPGGAGRGGAPAGSSATGTGSTGTGSTGTGSTGTGSTGTGSTGTGATGADQPSPSGADKRPR